MGENLSVGRVGVVTFNGMQVVCVERACTATIKYHVRKPKPTVRYSAFQHAAYGGVAATSGRFIVALGLPVVHANRGVSRQ